MSAAPAVDRLAPAGRRLETVLPPEGVPLRFEIAGLAARGSAQAIDLILTVLFALALTLTLNAIVGGVGAAVLAIGSLIFFLIRAPYYAATELLWNGQTLGKRLLGLRVISAGGGGLTAFQAVARNLMKELEVFGPLTALLAGATGWISALILMAWVALVLFFPFFNRRRQRLGDLMADTYVIVQPQTLLPPDLAAAPAPAAERFPFQQRHLEQYGAYELQVLEQVLQAEPPESAEASAQERWRAGLAAITEKVRAKIDYEARVAPGDEPDFLRAFYTAQRAFLETRRLFGDARADKHHRRDAEAEAGPGPDPSPPR